MLPNPVHQSRGVRRKEITLDTSKKEYQFKAEPERAQYNPFDSPHILRMAPVAPITEGAHCRRLFEEPS